MKSVETVIRYAKVSTLVAACASFALFLLGSAVLVGWILNDHALVSVTYHAAMNEKTALAFIFVSIGLAVLARDRGLALASISAGIIILLCLIALFPTASDAWDRLVAPLIKGHGPFLKSTTSTYTATSLLLIATSLATVSFKNLRSRIFPIGIFGPLVTAIGMAAILCYMWEIIPPGGTGLGSVAFHTSIGIFISGIGITALEIRSAKKHLIRWLPLLSGLSAMVIIAVIWQALLASQAAEPNILRIIFYGGMTLAMLVISMSSFSLKLHRLNDTLEERVRVRTRELSSANADLQKFSAVAAHDLRSPIATIVSFAHLILEESASDSEIQTHAAKIVNAGTQSLNLIDQLLSSARSGENPLKLEKLSLSKVLEPVLFNLTAKIKETNASIRVHTEGVICGDEMKLIQLFQNLIANALKFTAAGVQPRIEIQTVDKTEFVEIAIRDNGIGIPIEQKEKIFDYLERSPAVTGYDGSGIGLSVCQRIVTQHGGKIWYEPNNGGGTTFFFTLTKPR